MNKRVVSVMLTTLLLLVIFVSGTVKANNNQYCLWGRGNCVWFTYETMCIVWPVEFNVPGEYDACQWVNLIGQENDGYRIEKVNTVEVGDIIITPSTRNNHYGHVAMVSEVRLVIDMESGEYSKWYTVIESSIYPEQREYPEVMSNGCLYRYHSIPAEYIAERECTVIRCVEIKK